MGPARRRRSGLARVSAVNESAASRAARAARFIPRHVREVLSAGEMGRIDDSSRGCPRGGEVLRMDLAEDMRAVRLQVLLRAGPREALKRSPR